jgi:hypothetical protein
VTERREIVDAFDALCKHADDHRRLRVVIVIAVRAELDDPQ